MAFKPPNYNREIEIELRSTTPNALNEGVENWSRVFKTWAAISYGTGSEQRTAAQTRGVQTATFLIRYTQISAGIGLTVASHRIRASDGVWNITAHNIVGRNDAIRITAVRDAP
jgi:SPP1 family predicted phage head-tail adaptor